VREVDQLENAVDERIAERDERIQGPLRDAYEENAAEVVGSLDEVDDEPREHEQDEEDPEDPARDRAEIPPALDGLSVRLGDQIRPP